MEQNGGALSPADGFSLSALSDCITDCWSSRQGIIALILLCPKWGWGECMHVQVREKVAHKGYLVLCVSLLCE